MIYQNTDDDMNNNKDEVVNNIVNNIYDLEILILKMETDIKYLFDKIILPYQNDLQRSQILNKSNDIYIKFYGYMIENSPSYQMIMSKLQHLYKLQQNNVKN
jgi:hypothetical protein